MALLAGGCSNVTNTEERTLTVYGSGTVQAIPDTATLTLGVEVTKSTAQLAQVSAARTSKRIIDSIISSGIKQENIRTSSFNIWPEMAYEPNKPPRLTGYRCSNTISIDISGTDRVSRILDSSVRSGANSVQGIVFRFKDDNKLKNEALEKAVRNAREKAETVARASGTKIERILRVIESGNYAYDAPMVKMDRANMAMAAPETPIMQGQDQITANVVVVFNIEK